MGSALEVELEEVVVFAMKFSTLLKYGLIAGDSFTTYPEDH